MAGASQAVNLGDRAEEEQVGEMSLSTDDLKGLPHVVIIETENGFRLIEFEGENAMENAHVDATKIATEPGFFGRVIIAARVRTVGPYNYAKKYSVGICR